MCVILLGQVVDSLPGQIVNVLCGQNGALSTLRSLNVPLGCDNGGADMSPMCQAKPNLALAVQ
jgi:hypothetical protein